METPLTGNAPPASRPNILVVDDEETARKFLEHFLELLGCSVKSVASGQEAVQAVKAACPDLVFLDIVLPVMDGVETLRELQEIHPRIAVVMISGPENIQRAQRALSYGARDFLAKPFTLDTLKKTLKIHLGFPAKPPLLG